MTIFCVKVYLRCTYIHIYVQINMIIFVMPQTLYLKAQQYILHHIQKTV